MICLPRGGLALISMLGVWKAGAAFAIDEYNSPPERSAALGDGRTAGGAPEDTAVTEMRERGKAHPLTPNQISIFDYCIYSEEKIMRAEKVFSGLLHTLMTAEPSDRIGTLL